MGQAEMLATGLGLPLTLGAEPSTQPLFHNCVTPDQVQKLVFRENPPAVLDPHKQRLQHFGCQGHRFAAVQRYHDAFRPWQRPRRRRARRLRASRSGGR